MRRDDQSELPLLHLALILSLAGSSVALLLRVCSAGPVEGQRISASGEIRTSRSRGTGHRAKLCGVYFNPQVRPGGPRFPWLRHYDKCRHAVNKELAELVGKTGINFICIQLLIADTLKDGAPVSHWGSKITDWADLAALDNLVAFLAHCRTLGVCVEIDLANNMWIPYAVDCAHHTANHRWWPKPSATPWVESIVWYTQVIQYVEGKASDPGTIALWDMFGNYQLGGAEPVLWNTPDCPEIARWTEAFVKRVWPAFRKAGSRPKGAPIVLPILSKSDYWRQKSAAERLSAVSNLKRWLVDDLKMPPDYWVMTSYVRSDPATDGFCYLKAIVDILGRQNAGRIVSTDFKGPGHDLSGAIVDTRGMTGAEMLQWHFAKVDEYGLGGWWIWSYRDTATSQTGIRDAQGRWKEDLVNVIRQRTGLLGRH